MSQERLMIACADGEHTRCDGSGRDSTVGCSCRCHRRKAGHVHQWAPLLGASRGQLWPQHCTDGGCTAKLIDHEVVW
jgi:hypothetical protein